MAFPSGWNRRCALVIQSSQVDSDLTNFPVLFSIDNLPSEMFDSDGNYPAQNGGGDIRFTTDRAGTARLACEVVSFVTNANPALGSAQIYVNVSSISSSLDTTIYVWYNTSTTESQPARYEAYGTEATWDSNYQTVLHLEENPGSTEEGWKDSTQSWYNGTGLGNTGTPGSVTGKLGNAASFDSANGQYIQLIFDIINGSDDYVIEAWSYYSGTLSTSMIVWEGDSTGDGFGSTPETHLSLDSSLARTDFAECGTDDLTPDLSSYISANTWIYRAFRVNDANTSSPSAKSWANTNTATDVATAAVNYTTFDTGTRIGRPGQDGRYWNGYIDEVRISNSSRSDGWILATYNSTSAPGTFVVPSTPELVRSPRFGFVFFQSPGIA